MKRIDFEGTTHEFPDDFSDADISSALGGGPKPDTRSGVTRLYQDYLAKPLTKVVSRAADSLTEPLVAAERVHQGEPVSRVLGSYLTLNPAKPAPLTNPLAEAVVPQTPLEAGMMVGTMGAGGVAARAGLRPGLQALSRILGGAVGGEGGNQLEGGPTGKGALVGGAGATAGEGLGLLAQRLRLALPGGKRAANDADAARIGTAVGDAVPELAGARTTPDLRAMTEGGGREALGQAKEGTTQAIEGALGGQPITVPAIGPTPVPLRAANDAMSEVGARAFSRNPLDRTFQGVDQRRLYGQMRREIPAGVNAGAGPDAANAFEAGQETHSAGSKLLDFFTKSGVVDNDGFLNVAKMQRLLNSPKNVAILERHLGPEGFARFENALTRGAGRGETDRMTSGMGGSLDALMQVLRGQNTGAAQYARIPIATLLPNLGSKYVGRNPLALPEGLRTILDLGAQRSGAALVEP